MDALKPYFTANGRTGIHAFRKVVAGCVTAIIIGLWLINSGTEVRCTGFGPCSEHYTVLAWLGGLINIVFWTALICGSIRRLHDANKSGWFALINAIPLINLGFWLWLAFEDGTAGENRFGPPPGINEQ